MMVFLKFWNFIACNGCIVAKTQKLYIRLFMYKRAYTILTRFKWIQRGDCTQTINTVKFKLIIILDYMISCMYNCTISLYNIIDKHYKYKIYKLKDIILKI